MNEDIRSKTFGILIHQLPLEFCDEVVRLFSEKYVQRVTLDRDTGLQVYFNKYEYARETIIKQKIQIKGISYRVYPLVTNITVYNIGYYELKSEVLKLLSYYGKIIDQYEIKDEYTERFTADYRIILDVPEILADFNLPYILHLPEDIRHSFRVEFFCRLCRKNGHKQYECPQHFPPSRKEDECFQKCYKTKDPFESSDGDEYLPHHNSRDLGQNRNELAGCSEDVRSSERRITRMEETNNFSARDDSLSCEIQQIDCSEAEFRRDDYFAGYRRCHKQEDNDRKEQENQRNEETENLPNTEMLRNIMNAVKAQEQREHSVIKTDATIMHKNAHHESLDNKCKDLVQNKDCSTKEETICEWRSIEEVVPNTSIPNSIVQRKSIDICFKTKGSPSEKMRPVLSAFAEKLLKHAYDNEPKDISPNMEQELRSLLRELSSVQNGNSELRSRRDFLDRYLERVVRERRIHKRSIREEVEPKGGQLVQSSGPSSRTKKTELSPGIKNVIAKVRGLLPPPELCKFLNQVRCRKKRLEIARYFTANISALVLQLQDVVKAYYVQGDRGAAEDRDIRFIKGVAGGLSTDIGKAVGPMFKMEPIA